MCLDFKIKKKFKTITFFLWVSSKKGLLVTVCFLFSFFYDSCFIIFPSQNRERSSTTQTTPETSRVECVCAASVTVLLALFEVCWIINEGRRRRRRTAMVTMTLGTWVVDGEWERAKMWKLEGSWLYCWQFEVFLTVESPCSKSGLNTFFCVFVSACTLFKCFFFVWRF